MTRKVEEARGFAAAAKTRHNWGIAMIVHPADQEIVKWAMQRSSPHYYTSEHGLPEPCLKVQCGHVTAYFHEGRLERVWAQADSPLLDDMFAELTQLFRLCAPRHNRSGFRPGMSLSTS